MKKLQPNEALSGPATAETSVTVVSPANTDERQTLRAQEQGLRNVRNHVEIADDRIQRAAVAWVAPPEPTRAEFDALLNDINVECQRVIETATELLLRRGA